MITLTPAYGKDYKRAKEAIEAYERGTDFLVNDMTSRFDGSYVNIREMNNRAVRLRFCCKVKSVIYDPKGKLN